MDFKRYMPQKKFTLWDFVVIALMAAVGIVVKPYVSSAVHLVSAPLMIPGGSLAGGVYMLWIVLAYAVTGKLGTATLVGLVQALVVMFTGMPGSHGILSLFSYAAPGIAVDALMFLLRALRRPFDRLACFLGGVAANMTGTLVVNLVFFRLPPFPLALTALVAAFSGGLGGLLAWELCRIMRRHRLIHD
jgi:energy-coupling factor transport system substrate-specific component